MRPPHLAPSALVCATVLAFAGSLRCQESDPARTAEQVYHDLTSQFDAARTEWLAKLKEFGEDPEYQRLREEKKYSEASALRDEHVRRPHLDFLPMFEAAARQWSGKPEEALFLVWMVTAPTSTEPGQASQRAALDRLLAAHMANPLLEPMVTAGENASLYQWLGFDEFIAVLDRVAANSPHELVQAHALYCRAIFQLDVRSFAKEDQPLTAEERAKYEADLVRVQELAPGTSLALRASAQEFEKTRLQIGMVAPDIVGEDLDGVPFKLSDYRGKVVVLDFWGDW